MLPLKKIEPEEISVLLIEDSETDATAVSKAIMFGESLYDFRITTKDSLAGGMEYLLSATADVVLLDLNLPDAKKMKALDLVHSRFSDLPIVVISGTSDKEMVRESLHRGAQEFLIKGECSGVVIRQSLYQAIVRKQVEKAYLRGEKL